MNFKKIFFFRIFVTGNNLYQKALLIKAPMLSLLSDNYKNHVLTKRSINVKMDNW